MTDNSTRAPRRWRSGAAAVLATASLLLTVACSAGAPAQTQEGPVTIRVTFWGNDNRARITQQAVDAFEAANPDIKVALENTQWAGYWDKLATQSAASDAPDLIQMDESYIAAYGERGALLDLAGVGDLLPISKMDDTVLDTGKVKGKLVGLPIGITNLSLTVNPTLFEKAGVALPDDKTWTWDDYERIAAELGTKLGPDAYGSVGIGMSSIELAFWTRQHGEQIFPTEGQRPVSKETIKAYFDYGLSMISSGAAPVNTVQVENASSPLDASLLATNRAAMAVIWNTQVSAYGPAAGVELGLLRLPATEPGKHEMANKASMYWSISARSAKQQQAAKLINFLLTDPAATTILTSERGIPAIDSVRTDIASLVDDQARVALEFASEVAPELTTPSQVTPGKASSWANDFTLVGTEVLFGRITSDEGAQRVLDLLKSYS